MALRGGWKPGQGWRDSSFGPAPLVARWALLAAHPRSDGLGGPCPGSCGAAGARRAVVAAYRVSPLRKGGSAGLAGASILARWVGVGGELAAVAQMSMYITDKTLRAALAKALSGSKCIQAWLGYGSVIFIGFGTDEKDLQDIGRRFPVPPYQIVADVGAQWAVRASGRLQCDSSGNRATMEAWLAQLVGQPVVGWRFCVSTGALLIGFGAGMVLEASPYHGFRNKDAAVWSVRLPSGFVYELTVSGDFVRLHIDEPPSTPT